MSNGLNWLELLGYWVNKESRTIVRFHNQLANGEKGSFISIFSDKGSVTGKLVHAPDKPIANTISFLCQRLDYLGTLNIRIKDRAINELYIDANATAGVDNIEETSRPVDFQNLVYIRMVMA